MQVARLDCRKCRIMVFRRRLQPSDFDLFRRCQLQFFLGRVGDAQKGAQSGDEPFLEGGAGKGRNENVQSEESGAISGRGDLHKWTHSTLLR